jgi:putative tricarboxylic transport membrane protein
VPHNKKGEDVSARIRSIADFLAGLMFLGFGAAAVLIGRNYPMGSAMRMGPGYFPTILGSLLALLGVAVLLRAMAGTATSPPVFSLKPLALILAAVVAFALTVERLGIIAAVALVVLVSAAASEQFRWREVVPLALIMAALAVGLFAKALGLPFQLTPF